MHIYSFIRINMYFFIFTKQIETPTDRFLQIHHILFDVFFSKEYISYFQQQQKKCLMP